MLFSPLLGEDEPNLTTHIFSKGLVQPPSSSGFCLLEDSTWDFCNSELEIQVKSSPQGYHPPKQKNPSIHHTGVSEISGFSPQIIHFNRVFHYKPSILGYPYFWKTPIRVQTQPSPLRGSKSLFRKPETSRTWSWELSRVKVQQLIFAHHQKNTQKNEGDAWGKFWDVFSCQLSTCHDF